MIAVFAGHSYRMAEVSGVWGDMTTRPGDLRLVCGAWVHEKGTPGGRCTFAAHAKERLRKARFEWPEHLDAKVTEMLKNVRSGMSTSFNDATARRFYPLLIAAILFVGSTVNKTKRFARRLWNPARCFGAGEPVLARARDPDGAAEAEWKAAGQKARMNWWAEVEAGIERDREQRKQLKEKLSQLSTREQVVTALTNQDKDAAALQLAIGHEVARFVWRHLLQRACLRSLKEHLTRCNGEAGEKLRVALHGGAKLTTWVYSTKRKKSPLTREETAPMVAAIFCAARGIGDDLVGRELLKVSGGVVCLRAAPICFHWHKLLTDTNL